MSSVLEQLEAGVLNGAKKVSLTNLKLTSLPSALFQLADTLEILEVSGNLLTTLPDEMAQLKKLKILFASNNPFGTVPAVLGRCESLEMIGLRSCQLTSVPAESLPLQLRWLILTDNKLTALPDALGQRPRLQKLMLSCNALTSFPDLRACTRLELLRLAGNQFDALLPSPFLAEMPSLMWLAVAGNPATTAIEEASVNNFSSDDKNIANENSESNNATKNKVFQFNDFELHECLGEGASGHIYRATLVKQQQQQEQEEESGNGSTTTAAPSAIAVKIFKAACTSDGTPHSELAAGLIAGQHPCLITPLGQVVGDPQGRLAMALPLLDTKLMVNLAGPPSFDSCTRDVYPPHLDQFPSAAVANRLVECVRSAVEHLHSKGIVHGDIYAHNVLYNPATGDAVLSDLGAAALIATLPRSVQEAMYAMEWRAFNVFKAEIEARTPAPPAPTTHL